MFVVRVVSRKDIQLSCRYTHVTVVEPVARQREQNFIRCMHLLHPPTSRVTTQIAERHILSDQQ